MALLFYYLQRVVYFDRSLAAKISRQNQPCENDKVVTRKIQNSKS